MGLINRIALSGILFMAAFHLLDARIDQALVRFVVCTPLLIAPFLVEFIYYRVQVILIARRKWDAKRDEES